MSKLVIVSNRLPPPPEGSARSRTQEVGGLASALLSALDTAGGGLWLGWSGRTSQSAHAPPASWEYRNNRIIGFDLTEHEVESYYNGFCNRALWPLLHSFQGRIRLTRAEERAYAQVNARLAQAFAPHIGRDDTLWVHDYHFFLLGRELRKLGHTGKIGFFLHVPFPPHSTWQILPSPEEFLDAMLDYDLVGFHTPTYRDNYLYAAQHLIGASWDGEFLAARGRRQRAGAFPIGIDPARFKHGGSASSFVDRLLGRWRGRAERDGRRLIIGVDRLDYTKGIPERILSFDALLRSHPRWRGRVTLFQICAPSRSRVPEYIEQKRALETLVGRVNGEFAEHDWLPIRYVYRSYPQEQISHFYREARVGLVTPLRDGMNLVAKEFIAAQDPADPGVLVLSRFAGASEELRDAILVNPYHPEDVADGIHEGLTMPLAERVERHQKLAACVERRTAEWWFKAFLEGLAAAQN